MKFRDRLLDAVKESEGYEERVYNDHLGNPTIGYGTLIRDMRLSREVAESLLIDELERKRDGLEDIDGFLALDNVRQDVLLEMAYQMGVGNVLQFRRMWKAIRRADYLEASKEMLDSHWARVQTPSRAERLAKRMRTGEW